MSELSNPAEIARPRRITTGIGGLDKIMVGGLLSRATHLIVGASGTGKTVLTQQIAYYRAQQGDTVLYLTLLSESHEKMIGNLSSFSFFDEKLVGTQIHYLSLFHELADGGLSRLASASREAVMQHRAKLVVLDGIASLRDFSISRGELRKALFDLNTQLSNLGCTILMVVDDEQPIQNSPEFAISDSIIRLSGQSYFLQNLRILEVLKARGTAVFTGQHYFDIDDNGLVIYPRIESLLAGQEKDPPPAPRLTRLPFGIEGLDQMLHGGLLFGTVNLMLGTPGAGKSLTGLRWLYEGARQGEKTMMLSFHQSAERIRFRSKLLGFDLTPFTEKGNLKIQWVLPVERYMDEVVGQLLQAIAEYQPTRLLIDAISDLEELSLHRERLNGFWAAVTNYLRNHQVTTLGILEMNQVTGPSLDIPERPVSIIADTIILLRSLEISGQLKRTVSVLEMRESSYDNRVREYLISDSGLAVGQPFKDVEQLLTGTAHHPSGHGNKPTEQQS